MVMRLLCKQTTAGSIPVTSTILGLITHRNQAVA